MISKSWIKLIKSLQIKKYRQKEGLFLVEGAKSILELVQSDFNIKAIFCTESFSDQYFNELKKHRNIIQITTEEQLAVAGAFSSNNAAIAVVQIKESQQLIPETDEFALILDEVKDPGNLGTIIRVADWYGIKKIICSNDTVDFYNPKVISSTMGSFTRVSVTYTDLVAYLSKHKKGNKVFGAFIEGTNIHTSTFPQSGFIVMGNESAGISREVEALVDEKITIPRFGQAESLNVAIATAVVLDNLRRN